MKSVEFCYWLQGYFEIAANAGTLKKPQVDIIKKHLNMVFAHEIDPSYGPEAQAKLNAIHNGPKPDGGGFKLGGGSGRDTMYRC